MSVDSHTVTSACGLRTAGVDVVASGPQWKASCNWLNISLFPIPTVAATLVCYLQQFVWNVHLQVSVDVHTNLIYLLAGEKKRRREGNALFNDPFSMFYLYLYGVGHFVQDHSNTDTADLLQSPDRLLLPVNSKVCVYMHHPTHRIAHTMAFVI